MYPKIQSIHRSSAFIVGLFILLHLSNHSVAAFGIDTHIQVMATLRLFYQNIIAEIILVAAILTQVGTGAYFLFKNKNLRKTKWRKWQVYSGAYLLFFLLAHTSALLFYRLGLGIDTNFYIGAGPLVGADYIVYFFVPYYFLGMMSFWVHMACVLRRVLLQKKQPHAASHLAKGLMGLGILLSLNILLAFSGQYFEIELPMQVQDLFEDF